MNSLRFQPRVVHVPEPLIEFGMGQKLTYPRDGLFLYGPVDAAGQPAVMRYGVIGTADGVRRFREWSQTVRAMIDIPLPGPRSRSVEQQHVAFPGFEEAFRASWPSEPAASIADIDPAAIERALHLENHFEAVKRTVELYVLRLVAEVNRLENPPAFWFVIVPDVVYELGRPQSVVKRSERIVGSVRVSRRRARDLVVAPTLFGDDEREAEVYQYAPNFRRQLKARLLKEKVVTQLARESTLTPHEFQRPGTPPIVQDPATVAWNMCTTAYYKAGGRPWQLANVRAGVCYVGLVYKRIDQLSTDVRHACCAAQMFLTNGDGIVFRGALGPWFQPDTKQFHLDRTAARNLITMVLSEYQAIHGVPPTELFIHAKARFSDDEWFGFSDATAAPTRLVGIQVRRADELKLFRPGAYPTIRGTALQISDRSAYLWTSGFVPRIDTYMGPETPNPIFVSVIRGQCLIETVLADIMGLTKINFNSCANNDRLPVTITFADDVGDVLVSAPTDSEPRLPFKFYI